MSSRAIVIGGGISGLAAAYDLHRAGIETIVFDKRPRPGGVIETRSWEDCTLDFGPDSFLAAKPEALALIKELGLETDVIGSNDHQRTTYIVKHGRLVPLPDGVMMIVPTKVMPMIRTPLLSWGTKLHMGLELLRRPQQHPDRSVAEFVVDHFGQETLDYLAEPLLSGIYGGDPSQLSVNSVLPRFVEMEKRVGSLSRAVVQSKAKAPNGPPAGPLFRSLKNGLGSLIGALARDLRIDNREVEAIEPNRVRVAGEWIDATHVIIAAPAWSAGSLLRGMDAELANLLEAIPYSSSAILSLIYDSAAFDGKRAGFGFLVPKRERKRLAAATFVNTKFPHRAPDSRIILRCFFGGTGDSAALDQSDESLVAIAREELKPILGLTVAPVHTAVARWPRSMAQYVVGHADRIKEVRRRTAQLPGIYLAGNAYEGIGIPDCIRTGRQAAKTIIQAAH